MATSSAYGVREFVNLVLALVAFYLRHKTNIDAALGSSTITTALGVIADAALTIGAINEPGPR